MVHIVDFAGPQHAVDWDSDTLPCPGDLEDQNGRWVARQLWVEVCLKHLASVSLDTDPPQIGNHLQESSHLRNGFELLCALEIKWVGSSEVPHP